MEAAHNLSLDDKPYSFRPYLIDDIPFIQSSWGNSYYEGVNGHKLILAEEFHAHHRPIRDRILNKPNIAIIVCASKEDPSLIIGYSIVEKPPQSRGLILHYLYVKQAFKKEKIASHLLEMSCKDRPVLFTHSTIIAGKIMSKLKAKGRQDLDRFLFTPHLI